MATFSTAAVLGWAASGVIGAAANIHSFRRLGSDFGAGSVYIFFMRLDSANSAAGCVVFAFFVLVGNLATRDYVACNAMFFSLYLTNIFGIMCTTQVSILRYISIKLSRQNRSLDEARAKRFSIAPLVGFPILLLAAWLFVGNDNSTLMVKVCMRRESEYLSWPHPIIVVLFLAAQTVIPVVSLTFDMLMVWTIKRKAASVGSINSISNHSSNNDNNKVDDDVNYSVPVKATTFSAALVALNVLVTTIISLNELDPVTRPTVSMSMLVWMNACRPLAAAKVTLVEKRLRAERESREKKRARERDLARLAREFRQQQAAAADEGDDEVIDRHLAAVFAITRAPNNAQQDA